MSIKRDNSSKEMKVRLRRRVLREVDEPVVIETHGGAGVIYDQCYRHVKRGVVMERDVKKAGVLRMQRPSWDVYECDCVDALEAGVGGQWPINIVDIDPYGHPFDAIQAFIQTPRKTADTVHMVVNDGVRQNIKIKGIGHFNQVKHLAKEFCDPYRDYAQVARRKIEEMCEESRTFRLDAWLAYYCGTMKNLTHYWAVLKREEAS